MYCNCNIIPLQDAAIQFDRLHITTYEIESHLQSKSSWRKLVTEKGDARNAVDDRPQKRQNVSKLSYTLLCS